jgi:hypothetical protein
MTRRARRQPIRERQQQGRDHESDLHPDEGMPFGIDDQAVTPVPMGQDTPVPPWPQ